MLSIENQKTENEKMKNLRRIGKIEAGVIGMIIVITGLVSAGALNRGINIGVQPSGPSYDWIQEYVYQNEKVEPWSTSLLFDEDNNPNIIFITKNNELKRSTKINEVWEEETLDIGVNEYCVSAKIDSQGVFHIGYAKENLMYLTGVPKKWKDPVIVDTEECISDGFNSLSLDLDRGYMPHISYYDGVNKDLKYAFMEISGFTLKNSEPTWDITVVDSAGKVGMESALVIDSRDRIHIAYYDESNKDLKYAIKTEDNFEVDIIDKNNRLCSGISIDVNENDLPHISHSGFDGIKLSYMIDEDTWTGEMVGPEQSQVFFTSLLIDENKKIHIGFSKTIPDGINIKFNLMYAKKSAGQWTIETAIDGQPFQFLALGVSLNLDSDNNPRMSYVDAISEYSLESVVRIS
jgi:hypothetical protein